MPVDKTKTRGIEVFVCINTGTYDSPVWTKVGGQKDGTINPGRGKMDVTDKDSGGWDEFLQANRNMTADFDCFVEELEPGQAKLEDDGYFADNTLMDIRLDLKTYYLRGYCIFTKGGIKSSEKDAAMKAFGLEFTGIVTKTAK